MIVIVQDKSHFFIGSNTLNSFTYLKELRLVSTSAMIYRGVLENLEVKPFTICLSNSLSLNTLGRDEKFSTRHLLYIWPRKLFVLSIPRLLQLTCSEYFSLSLFTQRILICV